MPGTSSFLIRHSIAAANRGCLLGQNQSGGANQERLEYDEEQREMPGLRGHALSEWVEPERSHIVFWGSGLSVDELIE